MQHAFQLSINPDVLRKLGSFKLIFWLLEHVQVCRALLKVNMRYIQASVQKF